MNRAIITAASNKFFPSLINLLGSIKDKYPNHPKIYVYDLGLFWSFRKELESLENVQVLDMPHFCPFWRSCYTWKTYILSHPLAELNFYMDAGNQVLRSLDEIFEEIDSDGYFAVSQELALGRITPEEFKPLFLLEEKFYADTCITAGIFGFKKGHTVMNILQALYSCGLSGLSLGFSSGKGEIWKNKGINKSQFIRDCEIFRHDTTLLSILMRRDLRDFKIHSLNKFGGITRDSDPDQVLWNLRLNFSKLQYTNISNLHRNSALIATGNRAILKASLLLKYLIKKIKRLSY